MPARSMDHFQGSCRREHEAVVCVHWQLYKVGQGSKAPPTSLNLKGCRSKRRVFQSLNFGAGYSSELYVFAPWRVKAKPPRAWKLADPSLLIPQCGENICHSPQESKRIPPPQPWVKAWTWAKQALDTQACCIVAMLVYPVYKVERCFRFSTWPAGGGVSGAACLMAPSPCAYIGIDP